MTSNSVQYLIFASIHFIFLVYLIWNYLQHRWKYSLIAILIMIGLFYDNAVIGLGNSIGESGYLQNLNIGRYLYHVIFTPLLMLFAFGVLKKIGISWAQRKSSFRIFLLLTLALMIIGANIDLFGMEMILVIENDVTRYVNVTAAGRIPIPAIVVTLALIAAGLIIWRKNKIPWLALGSIIMFIMYGASPGNLLISNIGEIAFCGGIVGVCYALVKKESEPNLNP